MDLLRRALGFSTLHALVILLPVGLVAVTAAGCADDSTLQAGAALDTDEPGDDAPGLPHTGEDEDPGLVDPTPVAEEDAGAPEGAGGAADSGTPKPPRMPLLRSGLHPDASDALRVLGITAGQITQTIGSAQASAGTHAKDGTADGKDYGCATDISVRGMSDTQIKKFLTDMTKYGFAGWYRDPGSDGWPASEAPHMHVIYTGAKMKLLLRNQCRDFFVNKNGLQSHTTYRFLAWTQAQRDAVKAVYVKNNSLTN